MKASLHRRPIIAAAIGLWLINPARGADQSAGNPRADSHAPLPVINYAAIKVAGSTGNDRPIFLTANDALHVSFCWEKSVPANSAEQVNRTLSYPMQQWQNGILSHLTDVPFFQRQRENNGTGVGSETTWQVAGVTNSGLGYGTTYKRNFVSYKGDIWEVTIAAGGPYPPDERYDYPAAFPTAPTFNPSVWDDFGWNDSPGHKGAFTGTYLANDTGGFAGTAANVFYYVYTTDRADWVGGTQIAASSAQPYGLFDGLVEPSHAHSGFAHPQPNLPEIFFETKAMSDTGLALGKINRGGGAAGLGMWDGAIFRKFPALGNDCEVADVDNEGHASVTVTTASPGVPAGPTLLQVSGPAAVGAAGGNPRSLSSLLHPAYQNEVSIDAADIVSNEKTADHSYKLLCHTTALVPAAQADEGPGVLTNRPTLDANGKPIADHWSYARIQLPINVGVAEAMAMNPDGIITCWGCADTSKPDDQRTTDVMLLAPVEVAVDADRNGIIEFDKDATSAQKPFRFWINDDHDHGENDDDLSGDANSSDTVINGIRDLEDITQLKFRIPQVLIDMAKAGTAQLGFKWKDIVPGSSPSVRVWSGSPNLDKPDYLRDRNVAFQTLDQNIVVNTARLVTGGTSVWLRNDLMNDASSGTANLLMEGVSMGAGKLTFMIKVGTQESEGPSIDLKLLNVRQMYERAKITREAPAVPDPWTVTNMPQLTWTSDPWQWPPDIDPYGQAKTIVYVHGWRMGYTECLQWADTTYKRLWQLGYKGRFYAFHWPTYYAGNDSLWDDIDPSSYFNAPGGLTYNPSEYRAWLSGAALASFVNGLPNPNARYLIAHSMGNVVSGSALLKNMQVTRYAMCNSAMAGMAYNGSFQDLTYLYTPDTDDDLNTRTKFGLADKLKSVPTKIVNFNLGPDHALDVWDLNNQLFKPQSFIVHAYAYFPSLPSGQKLQYGIPAGLTWTTTKIVNEVLEAMGYVTQARSHAAGFYQHLGNSVVKDVNMSAFGFGSEHSAEWVYSIQKTYPFWRGVAEEFSLDLTNR